MKKGICTQITFNLPHMLKRQLPSQSLILEMITRDVNDNHVMKFLKRILLTSHHFSRWGVQIVWSQIGSTAIGLVLFQPISAILFFILKIYHFQMSGEARGISNDCFLNIFLILACSANSISSAFGHLSNSCNLARHLRTGKHVQSCFT